MYIFYNGKTDYLEILQSKESNYGENQKRGIIIIKAEKNDKTIGYGIENASKKIEKMEFLSPLQKFSVLVKIARIKQGYTQIQVAKKLGIKLHPYQRIESGNNNPTLKTILKIKSIFPKIDLSKVA